jgi:outer membrane protein OmpA-like peptidoglycan-associated protein
MTANRNGLSLGLALVVAVLALPIGVGFALAAEQPSAQDIIDALKPPRITRGLTTSPAGAARAAEESRFVDTLRNRTTRSLTTEEREKIASIANSKPKIDLEINFEFNSAIIASKAMSQVTALGEALTSPDLKGRTFVVAGHTDAKGSETYNQGLSERRADAVKRFLSEKYEIEANRLVTVGYGMTKLKNPESPFAGENRRVQIVNANDK